jgi:sulfoxide reductase heme-binding subunit YedZ
MKKLGKRWKQLHLLVYPAAMLVIAHFLWSVKADYRLPIACGVLLGLLFIVRLPPVRRWFSQKREAWKPRSGSFSASNPPAPEIK